ncbi:MAG: thiamine pyrophosphate-dependent enzyme [Nitrospinota bacterium]
MGLGLALALPERKVLVLEGDGAFLMYLTSLATISHQRPPNLSLVIIDNSCDESGGGNPTVNAGRTDFLRLAQGAGIENAHRAESAEELGRAYELAQARGGPALLWAKVTPTFEPEPPLPLSREEIKEGFLRHLRGEG